MIKEVWVKLFDKRRRAYRELFTGSPQADLVLSDLKRYCRGGVTTYDADPHKAAFLAGRQDVFNRIVNHINLTDKQIAKLQEELQ